MRLIDLTVLLFLVSCGVGGDAIEERDSILISVKPNAPVVSCALKEDGYTCVCTMSECGEAALNAAAMQCNRLRAPIVIE